jgi:transposase
VASGPGYMLNLAPCGAVSVARLPVRPIAKSNAFPLAYNATSKFVDGLVLYRIETMLERIGVDLPRGTIASWMIHVSRLIVPSVNLIHDTKLGYDVPQYVAGNNMWRLST